jgi:HEAT repeat protein
VLTETPLLITIAAKVYLERKRLPERRAQLYQEFVDIWLDEARERGLRDELDAAVLDLAQPVLAHLAMAMTDHPDWTDEKSLIPVVAEYLNEQLNLKARAPAVAERFLRVMARRSGVFLKREERYEWVHPTFREYFAALWLNQQLESGKSFDEVLGERALRWKWEETIVALAEMCNQATEQTIWLSKQALNKGAKQAAFLAYRCWKASNAIASEQARDSVIEALVAALRDRNIEVRWEAAWVLWEIGSPAVESLRVALHDPDVDVRRRAAEVLGEIGDHRAVESLIIALHDPDADVRREVAAALGAIGNQRAVEPLITVLQDPDVKVRKSAAWALGQIGDSRAVEPLIVAFHDLSWDVLQSVRKALRQIGAPAVEPLIVALKHPDWFMRINAADVLGELGDSRAVGPLIAVLDNPEIGVRWRAVRALDKIGDPCALPALERLAREDPSKLVANAAREAIARIRARMAQTNQQGDEL